MICVTTRKFHSFSELHLDNEDKNTNLPILVGGLDDIICNPYYSLWLSGQRGEAQCWVFLPSYPSFHPVRLNYSEIRGFIHIHPKIAFIKSILECSSSHHSFSTYKVEILTTLPSKSAVTSWKKHTGLKRMSVRKGKALS